MVQATGNVAPCQIEVMSQVGYPKKDGKMYENWECTKPQETETLLNSKFLKMEGMVNQLIVC